MDTTARLRELLASSSHAVFFDFYRRRFVYLSTTPNACKQPRRIRQ